MPLFISITFYQNIPKIKLFLQKNAKFFEIWGLRPQTQCLRRLEALPQDSQPPAAGALLSDLQWSPAAWGSAPTPPKQPPLRISGYAPAHICERLNVV